MPKSEHELAIDMVCNYLKWTCPAYKVKREEHMRNADRRPDLTLYLGGRFSSVIDIDVGHRLSNKAVARRYGEIRHALDIEPFPDVPLYGHYITIVVAEEERWAYTGFPTLTINPRGHEHPWRIHHGVWRASSVGPVELMDAQLVDVLPGIFMGNLIVVDGRWLDLGGYYTRAWPEWPGQGPAPLDDLSRFRARDQVKGLRQDLRSDAEDK